MRRLVGISSKTQKATMALIATVICLTSLHMAAAARIAALQREQEKLANATASTQQPAISQPPSSSSIIPVQPSLVTAAVATKTDNRTSAQKVAAPKPSNIAAGPRHQIIISIADRKLALLEDGQVRSEERRV